MAESNRGLLSCFAQALLITLLVDSIYEDVWVHATQSISIGRQKYVIRGLVIDDLWSFCDTHLGVSAGSENLRLGLRGNAAKKSAALGSGFRNADPYFGERYGRRACIILRA
jgi:hypothetical protein